MSATGRSGVREETDFYETPAGAVRAILPFLPVAPAFDPCAGRGAILRAIADEWGVRSKLLAGFEIRPELSRLASRGGFSVATCDALKTPWPKERRRLIVFNPPYVHAEEMLALAIEHVAPVRGTVAALLRVGFAGSTGRVEFHAKQKADLHVLSPRPSFCAAIRCKTAKESCGWGVSLPVDAPRPRACPRCGAEVSISTSDATEYAWWVYGPSVSGRWFPLPWTAKAVSA
jgi:hypothetical protein